MFKLNQLVILKPLFTFKFQLPLNVATRQSVIKYLMCCLSRTLLIYICTLMVDAGVWKRLEIDRVEPGMYPQVIGATNKIFIRAMMNMMTNIRLAGEVVSYLSNAAFV